MQIRINNEEIDFTLEQEQALGEVLDGIQDWLSSNGFAITALRKDDTDLSFASRLEWQDDAVEEIAFLEITAHHPTDLAYDKIAAAVQYLKLIEEDGDPNSSVIADLLKGADDVAEMIDDVLPSQGIGPSTPGIHFRELADRTGIVGDAPASSDGFARFLAFVSELIFVLSSRMHEIADPAAEIRAIAPLLRDSLGDIGNIAVLLQTGKDRDAMAQLIKLIEILQKLIRVVQYLNEHALLDLGIIEIDGSRISEFALSLNGFLRELTGAMESGDSVLIGDLLEYEIEPKLSGFLSSLERSGVL